MRFVKDKKNIKDFLSKRHINKNGDVLFWFFCNIIYVEKSVQILRRNEV